MKTSLTKIVATFSAMCLSILLTAQQRYSVSGTVKDRDRGESIVGASVRIAENSLINLISNGQGFYSLSLPEGNYTLVISYPGYKSTQRSVILDKDKRLDIALEEEVKNKRIKEENIDDGRKEVGIEEVVISDAKRDKNLSTAQMGEEILNIKKIEKLPVLLGERDIIKTLQLLPGVKSAGDISDGFTVRGGAIDQNLVLLDEAPIYNISHLFGLVSAFNSDAIKDVKITKGSSPAQYGGRLSSVLAVKMKEGNNKEYSVSGGLGLLGGRISVEGPIQKEKSSFIVSFRRSILDLLFQKEESESDFGTNQLPRFYDFNSKVNYKINENNRVYLSGYFGGDKFEVGDVSMLWENRVGTLRWNSILNSKLFSNASLIYSEYNQQIDVRNSGKNSGLRSTISDWNFKQDFTWFARNKHLINFGLQSIYHTITSNRISGSSVSSYARNSRKLWENALYINDEFKVITGKLTINYGLRLSLSTILGGDRYNIYQDGNLVGTKNLEEGKLGKTYVNLEPRISGNYRINEVSSFKAGYFRNTQNLHLINPDYVGMASVGQWIGNSYTIRPGISDQVGAGYSRNLKKNAYELNAEVYYKSLQNQIDFKNPSQILFYSGQDIESELLFGKGRAYGLELIAKKKTGKLTGWFSYTLSKSERKIECINNDQWYSAPTDQTHNISFTATYQLSKKWSASALFIYTTGRAVTFPAGKYSIDEKNVLQYSGGRNTDRMPAYHRLDLSVTYESSSKGRYRSSWTFGIYNVYARENPYHISFEEDPDGPGTVVVNQISLFRLIPNITYNFKF
ncbi:MAG: TonB-dependent receptor [Bergeyella sp.]|nr:TonB-dependent receptor [Bergeyella sp.]